jgi:hypothetical protein
LWIEYMLDKLQLRVRMFGREVNDGRFPFASLV